MRCRHRAVAVLTPAKYKCVHCGATRYVKRVDGKMVRGNWNRKGT